VNTNFFSPLPRKSVFALIAVTLGTMALTGCGMGAGDTTEPIAAIPGMQVKVMGGETPIAGATVILWETDPSSTGYGVTARQVQTATDAGSYFLFTPGYSCTHSTDFLYVTATGGDVTNGSSSPIYNPNLVMVAALGSCANMATAIQQAAVTVVVNELSTVAAAYALGNFMTVNANGGVGTQKVYIGAPLTNNAVTGSCTSGGSTYTANFTGMTCTAAGLAHAFANALNLVNDTNAGGLPGPTAQAYTTVPGNTLGSVPQALINTLGNIMQYCTNSGNATSTDSTISANCSTFFSEATPPSGTLPTDTLSAMVNIAHNPEYAGSTNNVGSACTGTTGGLFCLASADSSFAPALSTAPHDWTLAIYYSGASNLTSSSFGSPQFATLDANDNVYVLTSNLYAATQTGISAMSSSGTGLWAFAPSATYCAAGTLAADAVGYIWMSVDASTTGACAYAIDGFPTTNGGAGTPTYTYTAQSTSTICNLAAGTATSSTCPGLFNGYDSVHRIQSTPFGLGFDGSGNLWYNRKSGSCANCIFEFPYTAGTPPHGAPVTEENSSGTPDPTDLPNATEGGQIVFDSNLDVFVGNQGTGSALIYAGALVLPNTGSLASPAYINQLTAGAVPGNSYSGAGGVNGYGAVSTTGEEGGGLALDSSGNLWLASGTGTAGGYEYSVTLGSSPALTQAATFTNTGSHPYYSQMDGKGIFWYPSLTSSGDFFSYVIPSSPVFSSGARDGIVYQPCYAPAGASACSTTIASGDTKSFQIDSTGSIWTANGVSSSTSPSVNGFVAQIIGLAYPVWPLQAIGKSGVQP